MYFADKYCHSLISYTRYYNTIFNSFLSHSRNSTQKSTMNTYRKQQIFIFRFFFLPLFCFSPKEEKQTCCVFNFFLNKIFIYQPCGWNKRYVQFKRMTFYARLTSTQNRSRFLQAYTRYFLYCNKRFVHKFFNVVCLESSHLAAVKEYTKGIPCTGSKSTLLSAKLTLLHPLAKLAT